MVEKMRMVRLLMAAADSAGILDSLQDLGLVHISETGTALSPDLPTLQSRLGSLRKAASILEAREKNHPSDAVILSELPGDASGVLDAVTSAVHELSERRNRLERLEKDLEALEPWGGYDPAVLAELERNGISISLHLLGAKAFDGADFDDRHMEVISRSGAQVRFAEIRESGYDEPLFPAERLPAAGADGIRRELESCRDDIAAFDITLNSLTAALPILRDGIREAESSLEREMASLSLEDAADSEVSVLTGYIPVSLAAELEHYLADRSIVPIFSDPEDPAAAPIRLRNNPLARLFEPITSIFGLPQYTEIDTTPFLAPFFAFFFGMCLADVGYGIIVTAGSLAGIIFLKKPAARRLAALGFILGLTTVLGGLLFNTLFGTAIDGLPGLPPGVASMLLFRDLNDAMAFSIFLGVVQILFGFTMQMVNRTRQGGFAAALQPAGTFLFLAGAVVLGLTVMDNPAMTIGPIPVGAWFSGDAVRQAALAAVIAGVVLILLFNNPEKKIWIRPLLGIWEMYNVASGLLGDVLSYIRLFALSLAGGLLGGAINLIATMIRGDDPGILSWFFMLLVLAGGHFINFALAALGAFVHPLRLTFVEFYRAVGFAGGGTAYAPFGGNKS